MKGFGVMFVIAGAGLWVSSAAAQTASCNSDAFPSAVSAVTGRPFSATEECRTKQILADGTRIENTETNKLSRDDRGRTRIERKDGSAMIQDPLLGAALHTLPAEATGQDRGAPASSVSVVEEDLGYESVDGVTARGTRTTTTIPAGQIGNDRQIRIVSEHWYSTDLQLNVKIVSTGPRYGETIYQGYLSGSSARGIVPSSYQRSPTEITRSRRSLV